MSAQEVDEYLRGIEEPKRSTLETLRRTVLEIVPETEQVISYRVPAFRVDGKTVAGFAALQEPLELPAVQRLRSSATDGGSPGLHDDEERSAFSGRSPAAEDTRHKALSRAAVRDQAPALAAPVPLDSGLSAVPGPVRDAQTWRYIVGGMVVGGHGRRGRPGEVVVQHLPQRLFGEAGVV